MKKYLLIIFLGALTLSVFTFINRSNPIINVKNTNQSSSIADPNGAARMSGQPVSPDTPSTSLLRKTVPVAGTGIQSKRAGNRSEKRNTTFRLKLSGEPLDLSHIGKMNAEDREVLLAQQKLMDEDDQAARYLSVLHQMKLMQLK